MQYNRLSGHKIGAIIRCFYEDITAASTAAWKRTSLNLMNLTLEQKESEANVDAERQGKRLSSACSKEGSDAYDSRKNSTSMVSNLFGHSQNLMVAKTNIL
jgi:hypothetical protein